MTSSTATPRPAEAVAGEQVAPPAAAAPRARTRRWWAHLLDAVVVAGLTSLILVWLYRLQDARLDVPLAYPRPDTDQFAAGDATFHQAVVTALLHGHWWTANPQLGAPFGQQLHDFPLGPDHLHLVVLAGLARLTGDAFAAVNLYFLGGYLLVAVVTWAVARHLGLRRPAAIAVAVLFAFAPFHQGQGEVHLFLAAYVAVPLGALLLNWQLTGVAEWGPGRPPGDGALTRRRLLAVLLIGAVVGSASAYFAFFTLVLLALVAVVQVMARRSWRPLGSVVLLAGVPSAALLANLAPAIVYQHQHGANLAVARPPFQSWYYGLDIAQLLAPIEDHRIPLFARASAALQAAVGWTEPGNNLGLIGSAGLVGLAVLAAGRLTGRSRAPSAGSRFREHQAGLALLALAVATVGGLAVLVAVGGLGQVRVWARMAIFLEFFALCAVGSWLDDRFGGRALRGHARPGAGPAGRRTGRWLLAAALVLVGVLDQTAGARTAAEDRAIRDAFASDARFGADATRLIGAGSTVFQLPVLPFPESGLRHYGMYDYDLLKGYLHAPALRWSYGGVKGRPEADWQLPLGYEKPERLLVEVAAAGFAGLYVDREGYADRGAGIAADVARLLQQRPLRSPDGRLLLFDLRPLHARLVTAFGRAEVQAVGRDVTAPRMPAPGAGFYPQQPGSGVFPRWSRAASALVFDNPTGQVQRVDLGFSVQSVAGGGSLTVTAGRTATRVPLGARPRPVSIPVELAPGRTTVELSGTAPPAVSPDPLRPDARFVVSSPTVVRDVRTAMVAACRPASAGAPLGC